MNANVKKIVITAPLREIGAYSFYNCKAVLEIILPPGLEKIGCDAFYNGRNYTHVYFSGTRAEYEKILETYRDPIILSAKPFPEEVVYYYSETEPSEQGNYWHYVDGEATPWFE